MSQLLLISVEESDSSVGFYDSESGVEIARVRVGKWPHEVALSADGKLAYVTNFGIKDYDENIGDPGASISIIDVERKVEIDRLYTFQNESEYRRFRGPHGVKITPDGKRLFANVETEDTLLIYDLPHARGGSAEHWSIGHASTDFESLVDDSHPLPEGTHNLLFSPDGSRMWVIAGRGGVSEYDVATQHRLRSFFCRGAVRGLSYTGDGAHLIASASDEICLVDPTTLEIARRYDGYGVRQFLYSTETPDGRYLLCPAVWEGQLIRIEKTTGTAERLIVGSDPIHVVIPDGGQHAYVSHGRSKFVSKIDWETFEEVQRIKTQGGPNGIAFAPYSPRPKREVLTFGAALPLSARSGSAGSVSEGQDLRLGYQYWQERVNESGGLLVGDKVYDVQVVFGDTVSRNGTNPDEDPQPWHEHWSKRQPPEKNSVEEITEELVEAQGARYLFGGYPSPPNLLSARVGEEHQVPLVTASGAAGIIYEKGLDYVFGIMTSARGFLNGTFEYLSRLQDPPDTVMFWSCIDPAARQDAETTAEFITEELGMSVVSDAGDGIAQGALGVLLFDHLNTDFGSFVAAVRARDPDVLAITGHLPEGIAAVRALIQSGYSPKAVVFSVGPAFPQFAQSLGAAAEHMAGAAMWSGVQNSYGHDRFVRPEFFAANFFDRFSKEASYLSAGAMACGLVYEEAFRRAGSVEPVKVKEVLEDPDFAMETFYSRIAFNDRGLNVDRPLLTIQLRKEGDNMIHVPVWPVELASGGEFVWPFPGWPTD